MASVEFGNSRWIWDGSCYPQLFGLGGIMITIAILWLSTGYFGGIGLPYFPYLWLDLGIFYKKRSSRKRPVRVYMDGCFDLMHYGHANALRQAKSLGDELVVGVVSDEEIAANKGPPVLSMEERLILVSGLKWVDEVIANAPYAITEEFMNTLFNKYNIDYIIHGDDPCLLPDGTDAYGPAKKAGRYKQIKRTEGVSSTDIIGRIVSSLRGPEVDKNPDKASQSEAGGSIRTQLSHFLPTSHRIVQFSNGKGPGPDARVVYIDGAFDLFHAGHVEILRCARQLGDFLLVGVHSDQTVSERRGCHPIMHLHERSLSVLACRYVDEVIIGSPWEVTRDMITTFNISLVVHGTEAEGSSNGKVDPYATPRSMGIFKTIASPKNITSQSVARRIIDNHEAYKVFTISIAFTQMIVFSYHLFFVYDRGFSSTDVSQRHTDMIPYLNQSFSLDVSFFSFLFFPKKKSLSTRSNIYKHSDYLLQKRNAKKSESENKYYAEKKFVPED